MRKTFLLVALCLFPKPVFSQTVPAGNQTVQQGSLWLQGFLTIGLNDRWSVPVELQVRRAEFGATWQNLQLKTAILYRFNPHIQAGVGYVVGQTWPYGKQPFPAKFMDQRVYEQLSIRHNVRSVAVDHRVRLEQRFIQRTDARNRVSLDEYYYANRLRYRGGVRIPLQSERGIFLFANDEVYFSFGRNIPNETLDQNRAAAGIGFKVSEHGTIQTGYLHQYTKKLDGVRAESNHTITVAFTYEFSLR